jgi:hyperosmotically inducible periplasmic protein
MKRILFMSLMCLTLVACDRQPKALSNEDKDNDNTEKNMRDRDSAELTPMDQSESASDIKITQSLRQAIMADKYLTMNAKNIKIITIQGVVTLRGPVGSPAEVEMIAKKASAVQGVTKVNNELEVTQDK